MKKNGECATVEKPQVPFRAGPPKATPLVPLPILTVSVVLGDDLRRVVIGSDHKGAWEIDYEVRVPDGPLRSHTVEIIGIEADAALYDALMRLFGIQAELEIAP